MTRICPNFRINPGCNTCANNGCNHLNFNDCPTQNLNVGLMRWSFTKDSGGSPGFDGSGTVSFHMDTIPRYLNNGDVFHSNICPASSLFVTPMTGLDMTLTGDGNTIYSGITSNFLLDNSSPISLTVTLTKVPVNNVNGGPGIGAGDRVTFDCWTALVQSTISGCIGYSAFQRYQGRVFITNPDYSEITTSNPNQFKLRDDWTGENSGLIGTFGNFYEFFDPLGRNFQCAECGAPQNDFLPSYNLNCAPPYYWWNPPTYLADLSGFSGPNSSCLNCGNLNGSYVLPSANPKRGYFGNTIEVPYVCACDGCPQAPSTYTCSSGCLTCGSGCQDSLQLLYDETTGVGLIKVKLTYKYFAGVLNNFAFGFGEQVCAYGLTTHTWSIPVTSFDYYGDNTLNLEGTTWNPPVVDPFTYAWACRSTSSGCVPPASVTLDFLDWTRP